MYKKFFLWSLSKPFLRRFHNSWVLKEGDENAWERRKLRYSYYMSFALRLWYPLEVVFLALFMVVASFLVDYSESSGLVNYASLRSYFDSHWHLEVLFVLAFLFTAAAFFTTLSFFVARKIAAKMSRFSALVDDGII